MSRVFFGAGAGIYKKKNTSRGRIEKPRPPRIERHPRRLIIHIPRLPAPPHQVVDRAPVAYQLRLGERRAPDAQPERELPWILAYGERDGGVVRGGGEPAGGRVVRPRAGHGDEQAVELGEGAVGGDVRERGVDAGFGELVAPELRKMMGLIR